MAVTLCQIHPTHRHYFLTPTHRVCSFGLADCVRVSIFDAIGHTSMEPTYFRPVSKPIRLLLRLSKPPLHRGLRFLAKGKYVGTGTVYFAGLAIVGQGVVKRSSKEAADVQVFSRGPDNVGKCLRTRQGGCMEKSIVPMPKALGGYTGIRASHLVVL